jgi:hypothetical protein
MRRSDPERYERIVARLLARRAANLRRSPSVHDRGTNRSSSVSWRR